MQQWLRARNTKKPRRKIEKETETETARPRKLGEKTDNQY